MSRPEDLILDEMEHPDQTSHLQQNYPLSQEDQRSLLRIRTRLLARRSAAISAETSTEALQTEPLRTVFKEPQEQPLGGQFLPLHEAKPSKPKKKAVSTWRLVALVAALCLLVLVGTLYALPRVLPSTNHPPTPHTTPTSVPGQKAAPLNLTRTNLGGVKMTSATTGWAWILPAPGSAPDTIARTTDGGRIWQKFDFPGQVADVSSYVFLDDQTAWAVMGSSPNAPTSLTVMHTTDGGQHWTTLHLPSGLDHITFIDQQHGWAWSTVGTYTTIQAMHTLYKTIDGGKSWMKLGTMSAARAFNGLTPGLLPLGNGLNLVFLTPQRGWATIYSADYERTFLYLTQDSGKTWQLQQLPLPATGPIPGIHILPLVVRYRIWWKSLQFSTTQNGVLSFVLTDSAQFKQTVYLYETSDGGQSWSPTGTFTTSVKAGNVFILDTTHLLFLRGEGSIARYILVNGQWQTQDTLSLSGTAIMLVSFVNSQLGWAYVNPLQGGQYILALYATSDGGQTWHKVTQQAMLQSSNSQGG